MKTKNETIPPGKISHTQRIGSYDFSTLDNFLAELHLIRVKHGPGTVSLEQDYDHCYYEGDRPNPYLLIRCERDETSEEYLLRAAKADLDLAKKKSMLKSLGPKERKNLIKRIEKVLNNLRDGNDDNNDNE